ncbi:MAG: 3-hydroxyacyl-CoA dehydrogenase family protein [Rubripirellula sp.]
MNSLDDRPCQPGTYLIGAGVVGRAILQAHVSAGLSVCIADHDADALQAAVDGLHLPKGWESKRGNLAAGLEGIWLRRLDEQETYEFPLVIESIAERLDLKQQFFVFAEDVFGPEAVLCSNTSTLRISAIASALKDPTRLSGMHFFMPVSQRDAVEVVRSEQASESTIQQTANHVRRILKSPLVVGDGPGFIVNRLLSPYLNQAMLMLGRGIEADQIERASLAYGMPLSPLELIDWIGTRTMFDAGRVYWQSFPTRLDPSPILPALLKRKRFGRAGGGGFFDYTNGERSADLSPIAIELVAKYQGETIVCSDADVMHLLSIPMLIEAGLALRDGVTESRSDFDLAMRGGLGYQPASWLAFFGELGTPEINAAIERWRSTFKSMNATAALLDLG